MANNPKTITDEHGQIRDQRGEWRSGRAVHEKPIFAWPPRPLDSLKWVFGVPGYVWPWNAFFLLLAFISYAFFTPNTESMRTFEVWWMSAIVLRNAILLTLVAGSLHLWLYGIRGQGRKKKYNGHWMAKDSSKFLFKNQVYDNVFWSLAVGVPIWSAYEIGFWWAYANNLLLFVDFANNPIWFVIWMFIIPIWRQFHFYWIHRWIHWPPLYKTVHYLHHKNINVGPWSGMAMHPIEHIIFFSSLLIHLIIPSHPFHMLFHGVLKGVSPAPGHSGFDEIIFGDEVTIENEQLMHYMHHKYLTVNYGETLIPLDKWFGSFHNGTPEADEAMRQARRKQTI